MKNSTKILLAVVSTVVVIALFSTVWIQFTHAVWSFFRVSTLFTIFAVIALILGITTAVMDEKNGSQRIGYKPPFGKNPWTWAIAGILTLVLGFLLIPVQSFMNTKGTYNASNTSTTNDAASLSFEERVPFDVAAAVSDRSLGDTLGNSTGSVKAIPMSGEYTASVIRRGLFQGYESVQTMNLPLYGSANTNDDVTFCRYSEDANLRLGGLGLNNNLTMRIYMKTTLSTHINRGDAVAVCAAPDEPILYIPMTKLKGFLFPHRVPSGIAIYNGKTGNLEIKSEVTDAPAPIYPLSIAAKQRESVSASAGLFDFVFGRVGFDTTGKDDEDPNSGNNTEFAMKELERDGEGAGLYATPLTPRGSSSSIVGISTIESNSVVSGKLNDLTIHRYEEGRTRDANSTVASTIISTVLEGYRANGLTVFEVAPAKDGTWTASIGKNQTTLYRANIASDGHTVTLVDASGSVETGDLTDPTGAVAEGGTEELPEGELITPSTGTPVSEMSPEELKALADSITAELARRAAASGN